MQFVCKISFGVPSHTEKQGNPVSPFYMRLRVVSNFGDGDCGAGEIHNFKDTRREGSAEDIRKLDPH